MRNSLFIILFLALTWSCSGHDFEIPAPLQSEQQDPDDPNNPDDPDDPDDPDNPDNPNPDPDPDPNPDPGPAPDPNPEPDPEPGPGPVSNIVRVRSAEEVAALGEVAGGTEIVWAKGVYADQTVTLKAAGTAQNPVVLRAEEPGEVRFTGTSRLIVEGSGAVVRGLWWQDPAAVKSKAVITLSRGTQSCKVEQCAITGDRTAEQPGIDAKWVSVYGRDNSVVGCTFRDKRNMGTLLVVWLETGVVPRHKIMNNRFERPVTLYDAEGNAINGQETIRIGDSSSSMQDAECVVEGNCFYHCHGEMAEVISSKSCANIYRGNLFEECKGSLTLRHGNRCYVTGNYFIGNGMENTGGVRIIGEDHTVENNYMENLRGSGYKTAICLVRGQKDPALSGYWQVKRAAVRNNIIKDCRYAFQVNYGSSSQVMPVVETVIEKNIVSLSSEKDYAVNCTAEPKPDVTWRDNTLYGGRQAGVDLPAAAEPPSLPDVRGAVDNIRRGAGVSW